MNTIEDFKKELQISQFERANVPLLFSFYGSSGSGKTTTAIVCAIGMAGPDGVVGIVDSEQKRSTIAAEVAMKLAEKHYGGKIKPPVFVHIAAPFHPLKYVAACKILLDAGVSAIVADSLSHAWNGEGGYLDLKEEALQRMAGDDWRKREACSRAAAAKVKPVTHKKLFNAISQIPVPTILCFRSGEKSQMVKNQQTGKTEVIKDGYETPEQEPRMIWEATISGEVSARDGVGGFCSFVGPGRKHTHPDILDLLPREGEQFTFSHAEALANWCAGKNNPRTESKPESRPTDLKAAKKALWDLTTGVHNGDMGKLEIWLLDKNLMDPSKSLSELSLNEILSMTRMAKEKLK